MSALRKRALLRDVGEKRLIADYIQPLLNPKRSPEGVGDDCALISVLGDTCICVSTDRVPADLVAYKLGLISFRDLGRYLATLNFSDIAACGGEPKGLLLNLGLPSDFPVEDLLEIIEGAQDASKVYGAHVIGGDLSDASEMNLVATAVGIVHKSEALFRSGARPGDRVFCSSVVGLTPTAFRYYKERSSHSQQQLQPYEEGVLLDCFRKPVARVELGRGLALSHACTSAMDVTDGLAQTFLEIAESSNVGIVLDMSALPIHPVSRKVASLHAIDLLELVLGAGADFQLVGTMVPARSRSPIPPDLQIIGEVIEGAGIYLRSANGTRVPLHPKGWNYYEEPS